MAGFKEGRAGQEPEGAQRAPRVGATVQYTHDRLGGQPEILAAVVTAVAEGPGDPVSLRVLDPQGPGGDMAVHGVPRAKAPAGTLGARARWSW